jgi:hypothetical protein
MRWNPRWAAAVAALTALQDEYRAWLDNLPDNLERIEIGRQPLGKRHRKSSRRPEWNACPCYGGRVIIIETFGPGCQPRQWPIPSIGLDSS